MKEVHPLKRKSVKPSSSTVRGMLPAVKFRALDAAMQSLRSAGARLEWQWKDREIGWVCAGVLNERPLCELRPTFDPLVGRIELKRSEVALALNSENFPDEFKAILKLPAEKIGAVHCFEFELKTTAARDLMSEFIEALEPLVAGVSASAPKSSAELH